MKVAHLAPYPRDLRVHSEHSLGGVAAYTKNLIDGMPEGTRSVVYAPTEDPGPARHDGDVEVVEVERTPAGVTKALRAISRDPSIEAVHVQFEQHLFGGPLENMRLALGLRRLRAKKRVVTTVHQVMDLAEVDRAFLQRNGFPPIALVARVWLRMLYFLLAFASDQIIVHEERMRDLLIARYRVHPDAIAIVPHGVDQGFLPCDMAEAKRRLGADERPLVLYFGYITGYKGVDLLVEALERVPVRDRARMQIVIAGKAPDRKMESPGFRAQVDDLEARIAKLAPWVTRKGFLTPEEISLHLAAADVVVFPYRNVFGASGPQSITVGHGRPFLASEAFRGMGVPEEAMFPLHPDGLAAKIQHYLDDLALRGRLESDALRLRDERAWPAVAAQTARLYERKPRVLLMGAYGQDNLGDEALLEVHLQQLAGMQVVVGSTRPAQTRARYGVPSVRTYGGGATLRAFLQSDAIVFGGGSVVKELPRPYPRHRVVASLATLSTFAHGLGRGVAYSAVGVEQIHTRTGRAFTRRLARAADLMQVRDEGSRRLLQAFGAGERASVVADAAYLLEDDEAARRRAASIVAVAGDRPVVILNPLSSNESKRAPRDVADAFVALVDEAQERLGAHVILLPFKTAGEDHDLDVVDAIARRAKDPRHVTIAPTDLRPAEALALLRQADLVVAMRHHGVLLSIVAGAPVLPVAYAPKTEHLVEEFGLDVSLRAADLTPDALHLAFWRAWAGREKQRAVCAPTLAAMRERARQNFESLRGFLHARGRA